MTRIGADTIMRRLTLAAVLAMALCAPLMHARSAHAAGEAAAPGTSVINFIGQETADGVTRVILHANGPIQYLGGTLRGSQVILDIANVETSLPSPVVELGSPEVDRVVIGPELNKDGHKILKVRLTGVRARSHKVEPRGNELYIDLTPLKDAGAEPKGLPKAINNSTEITARKKAAPRKAPVTWTKATPVGAAEPAAVVPASTAAPKAVKQEKASRTEMVAIPAGDPVVTRLETIETTAAKPAAQPAAEEPKKAEGTKKAEEPVTAPAGPIAAASSTPATWPNQPALLAVAASGGDAAMGRSLKVAVGRSLTLDTGVPITRVSISNPAVAEPVAISPTQLLVNGLTPGVVSLVLWPKQGEPIVYELVVHIDTTSLSQQLESIFPSEHVRVQTSKDSIVLSGPVSSTEMGEKIVKLANDYSPRVINHMAGPGLGRRQVMLKVKFAEVNKSAMTELGAVLHHVDPENPAHKNRGNSGTGDFVPPTGHLINDPLGPDLTWGDAINLSFFDKRLDLGIFITALKTRGLFQELAEPTLIAADGQEASFLAGGEFPVPIAQPGANFTAVTIEWKKFGISLDFKPTIRGDGVIVMKVKPEVSSLDFSNAILLQGFRIPSLIVRRAETEVELKNGQAFAIAGLYDKNLLQSKSKIPVLGDIPVLGYLFRSKNLQKNRTELLVIVTPTIVEPLASEAEQPSIEMPESFEVDKPVKK